MKRVTFRPEFVPDIQAGKKAATSRWRDLNWDPGEVRAAVTGKGKTPAFLTPAKDAFAHLRCTHAESMPWKDFAEEMAAECGVTRQWYTRERTPVLSDEIYFYRFEVMPS